MKPPKDLSKYLSSHLAGLRLMHLALDRVAGLKPSWRVKWTLSVSYWCDDPDPTVKIIPRQMSWDSGDPEPNDPPSTPNEAVTPENGKKRKPR